jgi:hypothetical protein
VREPALSSRRYRITPWPVRILVPVLALVVILAVAADNDAPAVTIPIVLILAGLYIFAAERCGVYADDSGLESRMTRRANSFRYAWSEIDHFELIQGGAQLAVVIHLAGGTSRILPSTTAWKYDRSAVERIYDQLNHELATARPAARDAQSSSVGIEA